MKIFKVNGRLDIGSLIISIIISEGVGYLSSAFSGVSSDFYECLAKPGFAPPAWVFSPVWIILYLLMGIAAYRVWMYKDCGCIVKNALRFYGVQLFFNFLWSIIFFRFNLFLAAFIELLILLILVVITTMKFFQIDKTSGWLMLPYVLWTAFAAVLNLSIVFLNK